MKRKEVYATSGTRMTVRLFAGWDFAADDARTRYLAEVGYAKGVPMGADLPKAPGAGKAPTFLVAAMKDAIGGNLDRIQIVKGWVDKAGKPQEKIYDVVWCDAKTRKPGQGRQAAAGGRHGRRRTRDLDQHDRRDRTRRRVEGSRRSTRRCARTTTPA